MKIKRRGYGKQSFLNHELGQASWHALYAPTTLKNQLPVYNNTHVSPSGCIKKRRESTCCWDGRRFHNCRSVLLSPRGYKMQIVINHTSNCPVTISHSPFWNQLLRKVPVLLLDAFLRFRFFNFVCMLPQQKKKKWTPKLQQAPQRVFFQKFNGRTSWPTPRLQSGFRLLASVFYPDISCSKLWGRVSGRAFCGPCCRAVSKRKLLAIDDLNFLHPEVKFLVVIAGFAVW